MRLGKTALVHFGTQIIISLAGFVATFAIGVLGGPADLGYYSYAVAIGFSLLAIPASGVAQAIKKRMTEGEAPAAYFSGGVLLNLALAVLLSATVLLTSRLLRWTDTSDLVIFQVLIRYDLAIVALLVGATALKTVLAGLEGQKLVAHSGGIKALDRILRTAVQVAVVAVGFGVTAITLGHGIALLVASAVGLYVAAIHLSLPTREHLASLVRYAKYAWVGALRGRVYSWMDTLMLGMFLSGTAGATLLGVYEVAWGVGSLLATLGASISSTLFPEMSELSSDENYPRVAHFLDEALAFSGVIVIPGLVGAAVLGERVLAFYRPEYVQGHLVLVILIGAYVADVYASQLLNAVNAVDRPDASMRVNAAFVVTNVVLNLVLIWQLSWVGAAIATAVSAGVRLVGGSIVLGGILEGATVPFRVIGSQFAAAAVMGLLVLGLDSIAPHGRLWTLILVAGGATVYFTTLLGISDRIRTKTRSIFPLST